jgi:hypothetical protein
MGTAVVVGEVVDAIVDCTATAVDVELGAIVDAGDEPAGMTEPPEVVGDSVGAVRNTSSVAFGCDEPLTAVPGEDWLTHPPRAVAATSPPSTATSA